MFCLKGPRLSGQALRHTGPAVRCWLRRDRKATQAISTACLPLSLSKEHKFGMDLRSSQQPCEVGEYAAPLLISPCRTKHLSNEWEVSDPNVMNDMQTCDLRSESVNLVSFKCEKYFIIFTIFFQQLCEK